CLGGVGWWPEWRCHAVRRSAAFRTMTTAARPVSLGSKARVAAVRRAALDRLSEALAARPWAAPRAVRPWAVTRAQLVSAKNRFAWAARSPRFACSPMPKIPKILARFAMWPGRALLTVRTWVQAAARAPASVRRKTRVTHGQCARRTISRLAFIARREPAWPVHANRIRSTALLLVRP